MHEELNVNRVPWNSKTLREGDLRRGKMFRVLRSTNSEILFSVCGRVGTEQIEELGKIIRFEDSSRPLALDLRDVTLVNNQAIEFLLRCESEGIALRNCPGFIREWISRQQGKATG